MYERKILKKLSRWNHLEIGSFLTCILACQAHYFRDFQGAHRLSFWQVDTLLAGYFTMARTNSHHSHDINNVYSTPHTLASNTKQRRRSHSGSFTWALTPGARGWGFMAHWGWAIYEEGSFSAGFYDAGRQTEWRSPTQILTWPNITWLHQVSNQGRDMRPIFIPSSKSRKTPSQSWLSIELLENLSWYNSKS